MRKGLKIRGRSIRINEVAAALKKIKRHKNALGLSGLVAEIIQDTQGIGTEWILDLCNGTVKEGLEVNQRER